MNTTDIAPQIPVVENIIEIMAHMMNYLDASYYESQFTYVHEQARLNLNTIYDSVSKTPSKSPSVKDISDFYNCIKCLKNVTDTDDIDYYKYMSVMKNYINL
jgi:hypothetical protein